MNRKVKEQTVGIRELKTRLSEYILRVKQGATIGVTDRGRRVARVVPETQSLQGRLDSLGEAGAIIRSTHRLRLAKPDIRVRGKLTVAEILVQNRE